jgi:hypothetical protein
VAALSRPATHRGLHAYGSTPYASGPVVEIKGLEDYVPHLAEFGTTTDCHRALRLGTVRRRRIGTAADEAIPAPGASWAHLS